MFRGSTVSAGISSSSRASTNVRKLARRSRTSLSSEISEDALIILIFTRARQIIHILFIERAQNGSPFAVAQENLYPPLRLIQSLLALARQSDALFKQLQTLLKRQVASLQLAHNTLKRGQLRLECFSLCFSCLFHLNPNQSRKEVSKLFASASDNFPIDFTI